MKKQMIFALAAFAIVMFITPASKAQAINSGPTTVALNATLAESLTLSVAPTTVTFTLLPTGTANGSAPVVVTTTWVMGTTRNSLITYAYFTSATALTGPANIPFN
jgi:predicted aspartyl protease